jgi:hypothetical protein
LDLCIVVGQPVDEDAHADEDVVCFVSGDGAVFHAVRNRHSDAALGRPKHLRGLLAVFDGDFVEHDGVRPAQQVGSNHCQQGGEAVFVVGDSVGKRAFSSAAARTHDEVDMGNFVAATT